MKNKLLLSFLMLLSVASLFCHPHLFVEPSVKVLSSENTISGILVYWKWDLWWSMDVISECDLDKNFTLNAEEVELVYNDFFSPIRQYAYFTEITVAGKKQRINRVENFDAVINGDETVTYSFVFPINVEIKEKVPIRVLFNDRTIYTAFETNIDTIENDHLLYRNIKTSGYGYYGAQIEFDVILK
jgi:ABC-type uncharacterized transport system substrate-binding protein